MLWIGEKAFLVWHKPFFSQPFLSHFEMVQMISFELSKQVTALFIVADFSIRKPACEPMPYTCTRYTHFWNVCSLFGCCVYLSCRVSQGICYLTKVIIGSLSDSKRWKYCMWWLVWAREYRTNFMLIKSLNERSFRLFFFSLVLDVWCVSVFCLFLFRGSYL